MKNKDKILILDFGSQYTQLIARRVREIGVFSVVKPSSLSVDKIIEMIRQIFISVYLDKNHKLSR